MKCCLDVVGLDGKATLRRERDETIDECRFLVDVPQRTLQARILEDETTKTLESFLAHAPSVRIIVSVKGGGAGLAEKQHKGFTRSNFLKAGGAAFVSAGAVPLVGAAAAGQSATDPLYHLRLASYKPFLHSLFHLEHPHGQVSAELVEITNLVALRRHRRKAAAGEECFSLLFEEKKGEPVAQGTYTLKHPRMGSFQLFLVPVGRGAKGHYLEAVVNRLTS